MILEVRKGILFEDFQAYPGMGEGGHGLCCHEKGPQAEMWMGKQNCSRQMAWVKAGRQATGSGQGRKTGTGPCI